MPTRRSEPRVAFASVVETGLVKPGERLVDSQGPPRRPGARRRRADARAGGRLDPQDRRAGPGLAGLQRLDVLARRARRAARLHRRLSRQHPRFDARGGGIAACRPPPIPTRVSAASRLISSPSPCGAARRDRRRGRKTPRLRSPRCRARAAAGRELGLQPRAAAPDLADERALAASDARGASARMRRTMSRPSAPAFVREPRLGGVFGRKRRERFGVDIGRIGEDQVVALGAERGEKIALDERDPVGKVVLLDIAPRDLERVGARDRPRRCGRWETFWPPGSPASRRRRTDRARFRFDRRPRSAIPRRRGRRTAIRR